MCSVVRPRINEKQSGCQNEWGTHSDPGCVSPPILQLVICRPAHHLLYKTMKANRALASDSLETQLLKMKYEKKGGSSVLAGASLVAQMVKNLPAMQEIQVQSLSQEDNPGEENGSPLQYSCLENSMDREAWWATVLGVVKSRTHLSNSHTHMLVSQSWSTFWDPVDYSPPGFSVHGIL